MVVRSVDGNTGTAVYINPRYVMSLCPDPLNIDGASIIKLEDGETIPVEGDHETVAARLALPEQAGGPRAWSRRGAGRHLSCGGGR